MTRKEINNNFYKVYSIGYCDLQFLLRADQARKVGYNSGIYGWNYDIYSIGEGIAICTGYRGMPGISVDYNIIKKYNNKAEAISRDYTIPYEKRQKKLDNLLKKFIEEIQK